MVSLAEETREAKAVPESLIYETLNGRPLHYRGYQHVLANKLSPETIMGSSDLQSILITILVGTLWNQINRKTYQLATNESGLHIAIGDNLSADIAIFEKARLGKLKGKYFDVPPKIVIEVDIKIDPTDIGSDMAYIAEKSQELFDFGVERVFWILSSIQKVIILQPNQDWITTDWSNDITILDGCILNVKQLLDEEEIAY